MSTDTKTATPRADEVYRKHRKWATEDDVTEAIEELHDIACELERELALLQILHASEKQAKIERGDMLVALRKDVQFVIDHAGRTVDSEVGELKCGAHWMAEQLGAALDAKKGKR
jgi:predicted TIM-barrel fold metal-dependent hydrolase